MSKNAPVSHKALVTGGTRGIGRAIAERLRADGMAVTVTGTRPDGTAPEGCAYLACDFTDTPATEAFAARVAAMGFDVLVNNAGINKISPFADIELADFERIQRVNVTAPLLLSRAMVPGMRAKGWGRIVNLSSIWGVISREQRASYSASKFALDGMTAALAAEVARDGILVNGVAPGFIDTELTRTVLGEDGIKAVVEQVPIRRLGRADEIAAFVAWLAGPENTFISGQTIPIDGGFTRV
ncbi:MAG: SDR family NAD(P)-dependent oxidoreductase [Actinomycetota bacterium]